MIACHIFRRLAMGMIFLPYVLIAQPNYRNDINIHAYRYFHKNWPSVVGEVWSKTGDGYAVSFTESSFRNRAFFNPRGGFLFALKCYSAEKISPELAGIVEKKYPDYRIKVVTEITDGNKIFYRVTIENVASVKTLSIIDGKPEVIEDLVNGCLTCN